MDAPAHHVANGGYLADTARKWRNNSVNNAMQFFKMQLFWVALPGDICKVMAQQNPNTITLDDMYQIVTNTQREAGSKTSKTVVAVCDDKNDNSDEEEVTAFQRQKFGTNSDKKKKLQNILSPTKNFHARNEQLQPKQEILLLLQAPKPHPGGLLQEDSRKETMQRQTRTCLLA